jgi:hypothetical protein
MERMWRPCGIPLEVTNQKCDIVDRVFHASRVFGHNPTLGQEELGIVIRDPMPFLPLWALQDPERIFTSF